MVVWQSVSDFEGVYNHVAEIVPLVLEIILFASYLQSIFSKAMPLHPPALARLCDHHMFSCTYMQRHFS